MADNTLTVDPKVARILKDMRDYDTEFKQWEKRTSNIVKIYRDHDQAADGRSNPARFNILWSNVQVLQPAVFSRLPKPDVSRRFRDNDPVGRVAALILERALEYEIDHYPDYKAAMRNSVLDRFLGGRGVAWVRHETDIEQQSAAGQITDDEDNNQGAEQQGAYTEVLKGECAPVDYVHWKDFGHTVARTWEEVPRVWRNVYMDKKAVEARFGPEWANALPYDVTANKSSNTEKQQNGAMENQTCIAEVWDKSEGVVMWFSRSAQRVIEERQDPLHLANFWPCARPLYATLTNDTLVPVPDYKLYQDQADQLNKLAVRIDGLIDQLKVYGVYDASAPELVRLFKEAGNGDLIPVKNYAAFAEKNGLKGTVDLFDLTQTVAALAAAYDATDRAKQQIYEIMGIADIVRGSSDPSETATAQRMKGQFGNMRLRSNQMSVIEFATELLQIKAQIICKHFQPQTILAIAAVSQLSPEDQQIVPQALELLIGPRAVDPNADTTESPLAGFRIEVSSDSMVQMDEQQEKADRIEFLSGVSAYLQQAIPAIESTPQIAPLLAGLLKFAVSGYKVGKTVEGMIDNAIDQLTKEAANPQPKPDPEMQKAQAQMQLEDKKLQNAIQIEQARVEANKQLAFAEQQAQAQQQAHQNQLDAQKDAEKMAIEERLEQQRMAFEAAQKARDEEQAERDRISQERMNALDNEVKLLIAERNARAQEQAAEERQEMRGEEE